MDPQLPSCCALEDSRPLLAEGVAGIRAGPTQETAAKILHVPGTLSQGLVTEQGASDGPSPESHQTKACP